MPHFRFRAVESQTVKSLSKTLIDDLEDLMKSPRGDFTFEYIHTDFYHEGAVNSAYPFVEILWFDRGQDVKNRVAEVVTQQVREQIGADVDVAVIFTALTPDSYYDNAEHY